MWQPLIIAVVVLIAGAFVCRTFWRSWKKARQGQPECPGCCQGCAKLNTLESQAHGEVGQLDCSQCELKSQAQK